MQRLPEPFDWSMIGYQHPYVLACHGLTALGLHAVAIWGRVDFTGWGAHHRWPHTRAGENTE